MHTTAIKEPLISLCNVSVSFGANKTTAFENISMYIFPNELVSIIGPNGGGKSSLLKAILGLLPIQTGTIHKTHQLKIGYVPQSFQVPKHLPLRVCDFLNVHQLKKLSLDLIDTLQLQNIWQQPVQGLSGGETQRMLLAYALQDQPTLLILDEPMQGLDPDSQEKLSAFIAHIPKSLAIATVIISHDLDWVTKHSDRIICIDKTICCTGSPSDVTEHPHFQSLYNRQHLFDSGLFNQTTHR